MVGRIQDSVEARQCGEESAHRYTTTTALIHCAKVDTFITTSEVQNYNEFIGCTQVYIVFVQSVKFNTFSPFFIQSNKKYCAEHGNKKEAYFMPLFFRNAFLIDFLYIFMNVCTCVRVVVEMNVT